MNDHESRRNLQGTALITGASSGIGATYAERLARRGHDLILVARNHERLNALATRLRVSCGVTVDVLQADLTVSADLARVEQRIATDPKIGILINNAGVAVLGTLVQADIDRVDAMLQLNVVVPTRLAAAAAKAFLIRGSGSVINIASVTAFMAEQFSGTYSGSKAYLLNLSQSMDAELRPAGVHVQAVLPGVTRTEIWERSGQAVENLPASMIMEVGDMVDAALAGFAAGELVTIPSLPDMADFEALEAARRTLHPNLSRNVPAKRYGIAVA
ncbi:MAG: SDR family oxidoreductase [Candidatus Dactylopiibacterium carminicum]|uniref:NAD(P)-dependent oxidoreductase n=1 Tax=Candidatus Dactylopiibacterium carminicum TaxID=857335 RepID=A0A272ERN3_9RHOO|nr:SDR family oxidoreductase [Candidatus Dactylopiibacterium carminicum]KAF7598857.1 NAD(P)-dependent oxidoreductase [Candidatus Dactylopiibacterium carminicum]PAS92773.1 MAG: SDR family oxidoreductase [Candidatus Dactylopiibacterium carminicum]PAS96223.1 MAG: SDR family oxidoreductase [Candidatus Dactylopiibacterium carminicum]PAS98874.1 MAG: SDR family oxidoreductase [Candidatus Dactylopiibacterium carminicum]